MTPEGELKAACRRIAKRHGLLFINQESKGIKGLPDTKCGLHPAGRGLVDIEFKRPGRRPEPGGQQWKRIHEIRAAGGLATWCDSVDDFTHIIATPDHPLLTREEDEL